MTAVRCRFLQAAALLLLALAVSVPAVDAVQWAWLGVRIRDLSEQEMDEISARHGMREGFGVFIVDVMDGTPAQTAGMKSGDLVVAFEERPVTETRVLQRLIAASAPGKDVHLTVLRPDGRRRVDVRLALMPRTVVGERIGAEFGFVVRDPEPGVSSALSVSVVVPKSSADRGGLQVGDVILQVNERVVATRDALREGLADAGLEAPLRLAVRREGSRVSLVLKAPGA
ncbi:MAG TPA: PDZ domain-containing protein [Methylomirabilota bacterium]|nr:PDZ domain-containing protein [Methylomirabilota bacterium]